jgi:hypothetical protein
LTYRYCSVRYIPSYSHPHCLGIEKRHFLVIARAANVEPHAIITTDFGLVPEVSRPVDLEHFVLLYLD